MMANKHFGDRLIQACKDKNSVVCVGLDPVLDRIPGQLIAEAEKKHGPTRVAAAEAMANFCKGIIDATVDIIPVIKPQLAYFEILGSHGVWVFEEVCAYAKLKGLEVIADAKRGDIGTTAKAYSSAFIGQTEIYSKQEPVFDCDAVTVNPYLGLDGIKPFLDDCGEFGKGIFVLAKTSNPSSGDIQDRIIDESKLSVFETIAHFIESWASQEIGESGYSYVGAVVGATYPSEMKKLRVLMPNSIFLVPGYGAQGGGAKDVLDAFNKDGLGAVINSSRGINYAYENHKGGAKSYKEAAREVVEKMNKDLNKVRGA